MTDIVVKRSNLGKDFGTFLIPEGTIEFFPAFGSLIAEINDIVASNEVAENIRDIVIESLTEEGKKNYLFLPKSIQNQLLLD
jgi:pyrophosphate--fructose-6-phosphate 1-phosphotransferase